MVGERLRCVQAVDLFNVVQPPFIDAAFAQRRKTLRSALAGWAGSAGNAEAILVKARVDPSARGEVLGIDEFGRIAAAALALDRGESE